MKRSKTLFVSNIFATLYSVYLLWTFGGAVIMAGGVDFIEAMADYFEAVFSLLETLDTSSATLNLLYAIVVLLAVHIVVFVLGSIAGWVAFVAKRPGKGAAILYLIGTICFPVYLFFTLPITIVAFIGNKRQKKINACAEVQTS